MAEVEKQDQQKWKALGVRLSLLRYSWDIVVYFLFVETISLQRQLTLISSDCNCGCLYFKILHLLLSSYSTTFFRFYKVKEKIMAKIKIVDCDDMLGKKVER